MKIALHKLLNFKHQLTIQIVLCVALLSNLDMVAQPQSDCNGVVFNEIKFNSLQRISGSSLQEGAVYKQNVTYPGVTALVTILDVSPGMSVQSIDYDQHGHSKALQPIVKKAWGYTSGYVDFKVDFVDKNTGEPTAINHIMYTAMDVDGNATGIKEFVQLDNISSYVVDQNTDLDVVFSGSTVKFTGPSYAEELDLSHYKINGTVHSYNSSGFVYRCGIQGYDQFERHFGLFFHCVDYPEPAEVVVAQPPVPVCEDITVELDENGEAVITAVQVDGGSYSFAGIQRELDQFTFDYTDIGHNTITLTITDEYGQSSSCTASVEVVSNRAPDIICPDDITTNTNSGCFNSGLDIGTPEITSSIPIFSITNDAPDQFEVGTHIVTWTVIDEAAGVSTCQQTITIVDELPPVFVTCEPQYDVFAESDECDFGTLLQTPIVSDNCGIASLTSDADYPLPLGETEITWTLLDPSGLSATCSQTVNVVDNTPPEIDCQSTLTLQAQDGLCGIPSNLSTPDVSDACGIASLTNNAPAILPVGSTDVTWVVTDNSGNESTCMQTIVVEDNIDPEITCPDNIEIFTSNTTEFVTVPQPTVSDDCGIFSVSNSFNNTDDASGVYPLGTTAILWTVTDVNGNTNTCIMTIVVIDDTAPPITCPDVPNTSASVNSCDAFVTIGIPTVEGGESLASLINNYNGTSNASDTYPVGETVVQWTGTDINGNQSFCSMIVTVEDNTPPTVTCPADVLQDAAGGACDNLTVNLGNPTVDDNCGVATVTNDAPSTFGVGTTIVTWTVTDVNGNESTCQQSVTLEDNTPPEVECPDDVIASSDPGLPSAFVIIGSPDATDDCGIESMVNDFNGTNNASDIYPIGVTTVIWTVTDNNGNIATCTMTVTVEDTEAPPITCPPSPNVSANPDQCEALVIIDIPVVSDNNGIQSIINDYNNTSNASDTYPVGTTTVVWTATDLAGNTSQCTMTVTVNDNTDPAVECADNMVVQVDGGSCEATNVTLVEPTVSDACGIATIVSNAPSVYVVGANPITWTVTDNNGNVSTCSQTVIVQDNVDPTIICPPSVVFNTEPGVAVATVTVDPASAADDCGIASITNDYTGTGDASGVYPIGTTIVTWTAVDVNGNSASCTMTVTVEDGEGPDITCPDMVDVVAPSNACEVAVVVDVPEATDNDGIASLINDYNNTDNASDTYPVGTTTVIWTATDNSGNTSTCSMTITVEDNTAPEVVCAGDFTVQIADGDCEATNVTLTDPSATDACGIATIVANEPVSYVVGVNVITWIVTDNNDNVSTCEQEVTVEDNVGPEINCPPNVTVVTDPDQNFATVTVELATATDDCGIASLTNDFNGTGDASGVYDIGTTVVTWTAVDINGNSTTCTITVTVQDTEAPPIECPTVSDVEAPVDACEAEVTIGVPVVTDNDGIASLINDYNGTDDASDTYPVGTTTVIWTVTDNSGNTNSCPMTVTVLDVTPPTVICADPVDMPTDPGICDIENVELPEPEADDACGIATITSNYQGFLILGENIIEWTVTDNNGNISTCTAVVNLMDMEDPEIECPDNIAVSTDPGDCFASGVELGNISLSDNCGIGEVTVDEMDEYPVGTTTLTWTVNDGNGNSASCEQDIVVTDDEAPEVEQPDPLVVELDEGACEATGIVLGDLVATDNCGEIVTISNDLPDSLPVGTHTITWTVIDEYGNETTVTQEVTVIDTQLPTIECPDDITVDNEFRECYAMIESDLAIVSDNCEISSVINDYNFTDSASDQYDVGVTEVVWTVTDVNGNTASCTQTITVTDTEDPSLACPPNVTQVNDLGECGAQVLVLPAVASDNCELDTLYNSFNQNNDASDFYEVGETTVTWIAVDVNGNEFTCDMQVTVLDTELPVINCPDDIIANTAPGLCEANVTVPQPDASDNCEFSFENDINGTMDASGVFSGITTITWTATDVNGNSASCAHIIEVVDNENPVIDCPADIVMPNDPGECGAIVEYPEVTYSDNCEIADVIILSGAASGEYYPVGDTTVTYQVIDASGNSAICSFDLIVNDVEAPQIICPDSILVLDSAAFVDYPEVIATDNCDYGITQIEGLESGELFLHGYTYNTFVAEDVNGLTDTCQFSVLVDLPPVAVDDVYILSGQGSELEINPLSNDFDPDGDWFEMTDYTITLGEAIFINDTTLIYNAPEDWCGEVTIPYTICDEYGLCDDAVITITVNCPEELFIPEGFSPDNDGNNDTFEILGLWQYPNNKLTVFNRWGHPIYEAENYDGSWDGTAQDSMALGSKPVPRGTYFYLLDLGNGEEPIKGFVYVLNR